MFFSCILIYSVFSHKSILFSEAYKMKKKTPSILQSSKSSQLFFVEIVSEMKRRDNKILTNQVIWLKYCAATWPISALQNGNQENEMWALPDIQTH